MKARARPKTGSALPRIGTKRHRFVFCWLPKRTTDHYWVWFEKALITEVYTAVSFAKGEWVTTERYSSHSTLFQQYDGKI